MEMQTYRSEAQHGFVHQEGELVVGQRIGSCNFLMETPAVRAEFNSDGCCSRYRSAASRLPTTSIAISHRNVQDGICDAGGYDMLCTQFKKHLPPRPWKANEAHEALTILRSGSESNTARRFLHRFLCASVPLC